MFTLIALIAAAPPLGPAPRVADAEPSPQTYSVQEIADGLESPWDIAFLGSGDVLVTEKAGRLRVIRGGVLLEAPVSGLPDIHYKSQAGLFEASPHPGFAQNGLVYLTYAVGEPGENTLALGRGRYVATEEGADLVGFEELFRADAIRQSDAHYGGRMVWQADGTLLLTSGDGYRYRYQAQELDSHFGKVLRLTADGAPAPDNPFVGTPGVLPEIYTYGHRNPQGIARVGRSVIETEHGPRGGDEINEIKPGQNYGWPIATYGIDYSGVPVSPFTEWEGTEQPLAYWTPSIAPSALAYYNGDAFPRWRGKLMSSALAGPGVGRHVRAFSPDTPTKQTVLFEELGARIRDVAPAPDGTIWLALETAPGRIVRIVPAP